MTARESTEKMREACADVAERIAKKYWDIYKHGKIGEGRADQRIEGKSDGAQEVRTAILCLPADEPTTCKWRQSWDIESPYRYTCSCDGMDRRKPRRVTEKNTWANDKFCPGCGRPIEIVE